MNELAVFTFEGNVVRTQADITGNPWWVAKDVCDVLGIKNNRDAIAKLDDDQKASVLLDGSEFGTINESGLYTLILRSNKESAKKFRRWVTSEVLPTIRKTGQFSIGVNEKARIYPTAEPVFKALTSVAEMFGLEKNQALLYANKATRRETGVDFQSILQIEMKNPDQERSFTPTELGQRFGLSAVKFNKELERLGFQEKKNNSWCATATGKEHSTLLDAGKKHSDGTPIQQLKWRESVLNFINETKVSA